MKQKPYKTLLLLVVLAALSIQKVNAFCGFYVAKADATLFNKSSQVIVVRDGDRTVVTMSSDYDGDAKDFAMVVPVPVVLEESDIRVVQQYIFQKFDAYTAPRMVEYWDENPCQPRYYTGKDAIKGEGTMTKSANKEELKSAKALGVTIEAKYSVGEYDILILSALESGGLKTWLTDNGYKIPKGAEEVLDPYIKEGMKFFVVKVNLEQQKALGEQTLRPLQIQYNTSRFMLPIRLGMANANGPQDMIVYAFTRKGRVETSNYRTTKLPTDREIPEFIMTDHLFGDFYKSVFEKAWAREGKNSVMLEYAWDVSSQQAVKCDPCVTQPISYAELREAGIWWINPGSSGGYQGNLFVTRLHVRYARKTFPQDLMFTNTPDASPFQGRYIVRHAAHGDLDCEAGKRYKADLRMRHQNELDELSALTGWKTSKWASYVGTMDARDMPSTTTDVSPTPTPASDSTVAEPQSAAAPATGLSDEQESIAKSDQFLTEKPATGGLSTKAWLLIIAGAMLVTGILVRVLGRKAPQKPNGGSPT